MGERESVILGAGALRGCEGEYGIFNTEHTILNT